VDIQQRQQILLDAKAFFKNTIAENHVKNTIKLKNPDEFNINPFLAPYLANFAFGDDSPESIAKALVYPRVLGTSITTSFGANIQNFCNVVLESYASLIPGIDIEFVDAIDGRRKYCQTKAGPNTINKDDVTTILNHFKDIRHLARTNRHLGINTDIDCIVGVLYGSHDALSAFYKTIDQSHPVLCGKDFWHRLTGDESFYDALIHAFAEVAVDVDGRDTIEEVIAALAQGIAEQQ